MLCFSPCLYKFVSLNFTDDCYSLQSRPMSWVLQGIIIIRPYQENKHLPWSLALPYEPSKGVKKIGFGRETWEVIYRRFIGAGRITGSSDQELAAHVDCDNSVNTLAQVVTETYGRRAQT